MTPICTTSFVGWGFAPDPAGEAYSAPHTPQMYLEGYTSKGRGGRVGKVRGGGEEGESRGGSLSLAPGRKQKSRRLRQINEI